MKSIILTGLILQSILGFCCTTFVIKSENNLIFGRNLDWVSENGIIVVNQKNQLKESLVFPPDEPITWTSKYGSVTFNQFGKELPYGGINEKGLVIEIMVADAEYPEADNRRAVNELQWVQYQLDNASNIDEVIANDKIIRLSKVNQELHFLVADKNGDIAVIEFIKGKMTVYKDSKLLFPVLENDTYETSLKKYKNEKNNRFCKAARKVETYNEKTNISVIDYSFEILKDVAINGSWSIVYDIKNMTIDFVTKSNRERKKIDLKTFDFSCNKITLAYDLKVENKGMINNKFVTLTDEENKVKIQDAMEMNNIMLPDEIKNVFYSYYKTIYCK